MPFTAPPEYDKMERLEDYVGQYVIIEPIEKLYDVRTMHGTASSCWECAMFVLDGSQLVLHTGIRVFNKRLVQRLDIAKQTLSPVAGLLALGDPADRNSPKVKVEDDQSQNMRLLEQLWEAQRTNRNVVR